MPALAKVADRAKLKPRRDPYFVSLARGCSLGVRKMTAGSDGTWIARWRDPDTEKQHHQPLGAFDHIPPNERYDAAVKAANEWFRHLGHGGSTEAVTVREACERYLSDLERAKRTKTAADVRRRFEQYVYGQPIAKVELPKLAVRHIEAWRHALQDMPTQRGAARSDSSLNRDMVCLKAALNFAFKKRLTTTDAAWRAELVPVKGADNRRELYLDRTQRQALIDAAAPDIGQFIRALCALPLRPGAMAALTVADFDKRLNTVTVRTDKAGKGRTIKLPQTTAALFLEASNAKLPTAYLFTRWDGAQWVKDKWTCPTREAVSTAGLPAGATLYTLRHSVITDMVTAGTDLATVATISGTSIKMIQDNYHHLQQEAAATALERLAL